jgi:cation diffusion facilitator family transporter
MRFVSHADFDYTAVIVIAIAANLALMAGKLAAGLLFGSISLVADGVHSLTDVLGVIVVFVGLHVSGRPADSEHPYGHSKAEPVTELIVAFIIISTGVLIIYDSALALRQRSVVTDPQIGILVAAISMIIALLLAVYKRRIGTKIKSSALLAESKHSVVDSVSSLAVVVGLALTSLGYWFMDPLVGILVSILIIEVGVSVAKTSTDTLMDKETSPELVNHIQTTIERMPEVVKVDYVHMRGSWSHKIVDASIAVKRGSTVQELSRVQESIKSAIYSEMPEVYQVNVTANARSDSFTAAVSSNGSSLDETFAFDLGNAPYFLIVQINKDKTDVLGSFENLYKDVSRKKGASIAGFMREHDVDAVVTGHAGEGVIQWLRGYGIEVKIINDSGQTVRDIVTLLVSSTLSLG